MEIELRLYASLGTLMPENSGNGSNRMTTPEGTSILEVLNNLKIPADMPKIIFVNGKHAEESQILKDGDRLAVFPPIAGG